MVRTSRVRPMVLAYRPRGCKETTKENETDLRKTSVHGWTFLLGAKMTKLFATILTGLTVLFIASQIAPGGLKTYQAVLHAEPIAAQPVAAQAPIPPYCEGHVDMCDALRQAGFNEEQTRMMMAISQAESGLRIDAVGDQALETAQWGPSVGYWQIRTLKVNPPPCRDRSYLTGNLSHQAQCAYEISGQGRVYSPWSVFLSGAYKQFLK